MIGLWVVGLWLDWVAGEVYWFLGGVSRGCGCGGVVVVVIVCGWHRQWWLTVIVGEVVSGWDGSLAEAMSVVVSLSVIFSHHTH